jgi:uncharacterized membrane protein
VKTKISSIILVLICTILISIGQLFYKFGANKLVLNFIQIITNYQLILGLLLYGISALLLIIALKHGELSVLYPIIATSYIWVAILSSIYLNELINTFKIIGISLIFLGVTSVGIGGNKK